MKKLGFLLGLLSLCGCVSKEVHQQALQQLAQQQQMNQQLTEHSLYMTDQNNACQRQLEQLQSSCQQTQQSLQKTELELRQARQDIWLMSKDTEKANTTAWRLQQQMKSLQKLENEIRNRNLIYQNFVAQLQSFIDAGALVVKIDQGRLVLQLPEALLFPSGSARLNQKASSVLRQIGQLIKQQPDRHFQIEGHTDNVPISTGRFPSNWELSSARALSVVHMLIREGVLPQQVSAAGYGEFHPLGDNSTTDGRRMNRRIEIIMRANVDVLADDLTVQPSETLQQQESKP